MRTFKCDSCYEKCCVTIQFGANPPRRCHHDDNKSNWHEVKEEEHKLPKLTAEIFNHPACPTWANYASVNKNGRVIFYEDKNSPGAKTDIGFFDASDWQNSLIKRPAKALPDWCKVGEWVYYIPLTEYCKIEQMNKGFMLRFVDGDSTAIPLQDVRNLAQANQRPFNDEEMRKLVGKVIEDDDIALLVDSYGKLTGYIGTACGNYTAESLMDNGFVIDGKPCFVLEHQNEKGEWVK